jgi:hypothetical protein
MSIGSALGPSVMVIERVIAIAIAITRSTIVGALASDGRDADGRRSRHRPVAIAIAVAHTSSRDLALADIVARARARTDTGLWSFATATRVRAPAQKMARNTHAAAGPWMRRRGSMHQPSRRHPSPRAVVEN